MPASTIVKVKGIPKELGGETYIVPPLSLGALEQLHDKLGAFAGDVSDLSQVGTVIDAAHAALRRNYPEMTRDQVADMVDVSNMLDLFEAVMDISGARRKAHEAGGQQPGES